MAIRQDNSTDLWNIHYNTNDFKKSKSGFSDTIYEKSNLNNLLADIIKENRIKVKKQTKEVK